jgi:hypothetical protein
MIVWGGVNDITILNSGGRYDPNTDTWTSTSMTNAPDVRVWHTAVWTGTEMVVWGGFNSPNSYRNTGGRYNPGTDSWIRKRESQHHVSGYRISRIRFAFVTGHSARRTTADRWEHLGDQVNTAFIFARSDFVT